jgi:hypothetical protein
MEGEEERKTNMIRSRILLVGLLALVLSTAACATVDRGTLLSPTLTVVAGVAMLDPIQAPAVTYDAVKVDPDNAALIAAFAVAAAPQQARPIVIAATTGAPHRTDDIELAAKRALRYRPATEIARRPDHAYLVRLVDRATANVPQ